MTKSRLVRLSMALALLCGATALPAQSPIRFTGTLAPTAENSPNTPRGVHTFQAGAGQRIEVRVTSDDFDTVLELTPPQGEALENDDAEEGTNSMLSTFASAAGTWRIQVSSYDAEGGEYEVQVALGAPGTVRNLAGGDLARSDSVSMKGLRFASQTVRIERPTQLLVEMSGQGFSPQLLLVSPGGERYTSEGSGSTARIEVPFAEAGSWRVVATQASEEEPAGAYTLRLIESAVVGTAQVVTGTLDATDRRDLRGEHYDTHTVAGTAGRPIVLDLSSSDFDAYLAARSPSGTWYRDDDGAGSGSDARLELPAEAGNWTVVVTSFTPDETGAYRLRIVR